MFQPKYQKEGKLLIKGVNRFLHYRRDLLEEKTIQEIEKRRDAFQESLKAKDKEKAEELAKDLTKACEGAAPNYRNSSIAENIEVIFVAIAIALGIRAYIAQPFKIPTGSMQPTLNGIIANPTTDDVPNPVVRLFDTVIRGKVWENEIAKEDESIREIDQSTRMKFFTYTTLTTDKGSTYKVFAPEGKARDFGIHGGQRFNKGDVIARGWVDMGDHVIVDKFSYHFFPPRRGEVFVFTTTNIEGIEKGPRFNPAWGSQHYIKRLSGVPGDELSITQDGVLIVNGEPSKSHGHELVASKENGYRGYQPTRLWTGLGEGHLYSLEGLERLDDGPGVRVPDGAYIALGDNSGNSLDSRMWGGVPKKNLVGRAMLVYWPFGSHWGPIW